MKLHVLAGALALSLGATALAPVTARADDGRDQYRSRSSRDYQSRSYRDDRSRAYSSRSYSRSYSSRSYRDARYSRGYSSYSRSYRPYRSYDYRPYRSYRSYRSYPSYYYDDYAYGGYYAPYSYRAPVVVAPAYGYGYGYRGYRPLLGVRVGGPHFGVWLGF
jgi:hypothetical protein